MGAYKKVIRRCAELQEKEETEWESLIFENTMPVKAWELIKAGFSVKGIRIKQYLYKKNYIDGVLLGVFRK